jgi:hypothetical protein
MRIFLAAFLLRLSGATVEYRVQRVRPDKSDTITHIHKDGSTVLRTPKFREAKAKWKTMRVPDTNTVIIRLVATIRQRHGTVAAS